VRSTIKPQQSFCRNSLLISPLNFRRVAVNKRSLLLDHFASLGDLLAAMATLAQSTPQQPFIVVIDEFPYLAES